MLFQNVSFGHLAKWRQSCVNSKIVSSTVPSRELLPTTNSSTIPGGPPSSATISSQTCRSLSTPNSASERSLLQTQLRSGMMHEGYSRAHSLECSTLSYWVSGGRTFPGSQILRNFDTEMHVQCVSKLKSNFFVGPWADSNSNPLLNLLGLLCWFRVAGISTKPWPFWAMIGAGTAEMPLRDCTA